MKNQVVKSILAALAAAIALALATAILLLWILPAFDSILPNNKPAVKGIEAKKIIILDPGHGGEDSGAVGINGSYEKNINLAVALRMRDLLTLSGYTVMMTREDDRMLSDPSFSGSASKKSQDLRARLNFGESYPDAYFVSIHMNKFPIEKYSGLQVYYSGNNSESQQIATTVQQTVRETLQKDNKREIKRATSSIYILDRIKIPAVLIECGFLSNSIEEALLLSDEYQQELALVLTSSLDRYFYPERYQSDEQNDENKDEQSQ